MTVRYISASGSNTSPYDTWAKAATSTTTALDDVIAVMVAGDVLAIDKTFNCSNAAAKSYAIPSTAAAPSQVLSCTNTGSPPVAADLVSGAQITTTGANALSITGGYVYFYGVIGNSGTGSTGTNLNIGNSASGDLTFENCTLNLLCTTGSDICVIGSATGAFQARLINTTINFNGGVGSYVQHAGGNIYWKNTSAAKAIGGTQTNATQGFQSTTNRSGVFICDGLDLTNIASGKNICTASSAGSTVFQFRNCKITSGALLGSAGAPGSIIDAINCDSSGTAYAQSRRTYAGSLDVSTAVYNNASDGVTPHSWTVVTTANANRQSPFECFEIPQWVPAGTFPSSLIQITSATGSLTNADVWVEVQYMSSAGSPIAAVVSSGPATILTAGSALAGGTWAHASLGNNYQLAIPSFTTAIPGEVRFIVKVAKASLPLNIDGAVRVA